MEDCVVLFSGLGHSGTLDGQADSTELEPSMLSHKLGND